MPENTAPQPGEIGRLRFAYADPPYLGCCKRYEHAHPDGERTFDGRCWDDPQTHALLIFWLAAHFPDGWALSCNPSDLEWHMRQAGFASPLNVRVAAWCKTWHQIRPTTTQYAWEPVLFCTTRKDNKRAPMVRDWLTSPATSRQGLVVGAKPPEFNRWVLDLLCFREGDELVDLFPGSGSMQAALDRPTFAFARSVGYLDSDGPHDPYREEGCDAD